jgi:hypothetical protein
MERRLPEFQEPSAKAAARMVRRQLEGIEEKGCQSWFR